MIFSVRWTWAFLLTVAGIAFGQESINYATVSGRVTDQSGGVMQGARVSARQIDTNTTSAAVTDREGRFRFPYLRVGRYEFKTQQPGFQESALLLTLTVGAAFELPVTLAVESAGASMVGGGEGAALEGAGSQIAGSVSQAEVGGLPLNGRNFLDLALLVPGVSPTNAAS